MKGENEAQPSSRVQSEYEKCGVNKSGGDKRGPASRG